MGYAFEANSSFTFFRILCKCLSIIMVEEWREILYIGLVHEHNLENSNKLRTFHLTKFYLCRCLCCDQKVKKMSSFVLNQCTYSLKGMRYIENDEVEEVELTNQVVPKQIEFDDRSWVYCEMTIKPLEIDMSQ